MRGSPRDLVRGSQLGGEVGGRGLLLERQLRLDALLGERPVCRVEELMLLHNAAHHQPSSLVAAAICPGRTGIAGQCSSALLIEKRRAGRPGKGALITRQVDREHLGHQLLLWLKPPILCTQHLLLLLLDVLCRILQV